MKYLILHINCPDQHGIIAQFTGVLYENGVNVLNLEQNVETEEKTFFMRIYADMSNIEISQDDLCDLLNILGKKTNASINF